MTVMWEELVVMMLQAKDEETGDEEALWRSRGIQEAVVHGFGMVLSNTSLRELLNVSVMLSGCSGVG